MTTNDNDEIVYKREYTVNLLQNEQYLDELLHQHEHLPGESGEKMVHGHLHKDHNDPDPKEEAGPPPRCMFLKDQISNKLLIIKGH